MTTARFLAVPALALLGLSSLAQAQTTSPPSNPGGPGLLASQPRVWVRVTGYRPSIDSELQLTGSNVVGAGSLIDLESTLGLPKNKTLGALQFGARLGDRWRLEAEYFELKRSSRNHLLNSTITVDNTVYPASARLDSDFDSKVSRVGLGYSFVQTDMAEFGLTGGVHVTQFKLALSGTASAGGVSQSLGREERDETLPLPTVGLYANAMLSPNWRVGARTDFFSLKRDDDEGRLVTAQAQISYLFTPQFGVGLGYRFDEYRLTAKRTEFNGFIKYRFQGPQVFVEAGW